MTNAQKFRSIEKIAKKAAEKCESGKAKEIEIATWAEEIFLTASQFEPDKPDMAQNEN
jgi:hypothetical protein